MSNIFDYKKFSNLVAKYSSEYKSNSPYPYMYFDDLFDDELIKEVNREIDERNFALDDRKIDDIEVKIRSNFEDNESIPPNSKKVFDVLNGGKFMNLITELTGITGLISDPYYDGVGVGRRDRAGHVHAGADKAPLWCAGAHHRRPCHMTIAGRKPRSWRK